MIFQKSLNDKEIIFAKSPTISRSHKNTEIIISKIFTRIQRGISI